MNSNPVNPVDVQNMSIFGVSIIAITTAIQDRQWYVAGALVVVLVAAAYWYHSQGSPSVPEGTLPVTVPNTSGGTLATPTTPTTVTSPVQPTTTPTIPAPTV